MCEECEQGDSLMVVYSRKLDRRGWRPPAKARTVARHTDRAVSDEIAQPRFACEPSLRTRRTREVR